ncbi:MAG TPA: hypothetical protein VFC11_07610 [Methylocella sp.]|jgi:hypothetical protein|nr:hypothetical protein [Methylocella sp.]
MTILKHAFLGTLRIVFLGTLKFALFTYTFFLPNTVFVSGGSDSDGHGGKIAAYGATGTHDNHKANIG